MGNLSVHMCIIKSNLHLVTIGFSGYENTEKLRCLVSKRTEEFARCKWKNQQLRKRINNQIKTKNFLSKQ